MLRAAGGETFSAWDLPAYAVGVLLAFSVGRLARGGGLHSGNSEGMSQKIAVTASIANTTKPMTATRATRPLE